MFGKGIMHGDLRLDQACVFIGSTDGQCASIPGRLRFSLSEPIWVKHVKVKVRGLLRIPQDGYLITEDTERISSVREQVLAASKTHKSFQLPAGNYAFLFDVPLPTNATETATGPEHKYHTYQVEAILKRCYGKDMVLSQPLRVYKHPRVDSSEFFSEILPFAEGQSNEGISYSMSMPAQRVPFGSMFPVDCEFSLHSKHVRLRSVTLAVIEKYNFRLSPTAAQATLNMLSVRSSKSCTILKETHTVSPDSGLVSCTGTEWCVRVPVCLPQSLDSCSQSLTTRAIRISHTLLVTAEFEDDEGNYFDTIAKPIPFSIYMTPNVIGPDGSISSKVLQDNSCPPPAYGCHTDSIRLQESTTEQPRARQRSRLSQLLGSAPCYDIAVGNVPPVYG